MISHHAHLHQDEAKDFECLIVVGLAHACSLKPIFEKIACVLFKSSVAAQPADKCLVYAYLVGALSACKRC